MPGLYAGRIIQVKQILAPSYAGRSWPICQDERQGGMKNLAAIRKARGLSQADLAEMAGVKQATISRIEKGVNNPSMRVAHDIALALNVNVVELFGLPELEHELLERFRAASPQRRAALLALLDSD